MDPTTHRYKHSAQAYLLWLRDRGFSYVPPVYDCAPARQGWSAVQKEISSCGLCSRGQLTKPDDRPFVRDFGPLGATSYTPPIQMMVAIDAPQSSIGPDSDGLDPVYGMIGKMLQAIQLKPSDFVIAPTVLCGSVATVPTLSEQSLCLAHGLNLVKFFQPRIILAMGHFSSLCWTGGQFSWDRLRSRPPGQRLIHSPVFDKAELNAPAPGVFCSYHPRDLMRFPGNKVEAWEDLKLLRKLLDGSSV